MQNVNFRPIIVYFIIGLIVGFFVRGFFLGNFNDGWEAARSELFGDESGEIIITSVVGDILKVDKDTIVIDIEPLSELDQDKYNERRVKINKDTTIVLKETMSDEEYLNPETYAKIQTLEKEALTLKPSNSRLQEIVNEINELEDQAIIDKQAKIDELTAEFKQLSEDDIDGIERIKQEILTIESGYKYTNITFNQIKPGYRVTAEADHNIYQEKKFTATRIEVYE